MAQKKLETKRGKSKIKSNNLRKQSGIYRVRIKYYYYQ